MLFCHFSECSNVNIKIYASPENTLKNKTLLTVFYSEMSFEWGILITCDSSFTSVK